MQQIFIYESNNEIREKIILKDENYHYLINVLRYKKYNNVKIVLNEKIACIYTIIDICKLNKQVTLRIEDILEYSKNKKKYKTINIVSSLKKQKNELVIQKCCELNTDCVFLFNSQNTVKKIIQYDRFQKRYQKIAVEASKQCKRTTIPDVKCYSKIDLIFKNITDKDKILVLVLDEIEKYKRYNFNNIKKVLSNFNVIFTVTGPEGGFSDKEREYFLTLKNKQNTEVYFIDLGNNILRAETATIFAQSLLYFNQNF